MSQTAKAYLMIHACVLLWGFTPILGKVIGLAALPLVWWRLLIVLSVLVWVPAMWRGIRVMRWQAVLAFSGIGVLIALHWLTFYAAIKLANASIAAISIAVAAPMTAIIEAMLAKKRPQTLDMLTGLIAVPGVALMAGQLSGMMTTGFIMGIISAVFVALFGSFQKHWIHEGEAMSITAIEFAVGMIALAALLPLMPVLGLGMEGTLLQWPNKHDMTYLLLLSIGCTLVPYLLCLKALKHISAFSAQLATNLEPVYAMLLAVWLFAEHQELSLTFYLGASLVLISVFVQPLIHARRKRLVPPPITH